MTHLQKKPFYFLTDRETNYTYLVAGDERKLYYPDSFEQLSPSKVNSARKWFVAKFITWGLTNKKSMTPHDFATVFSRTFDGIGLVLTGLLGESTLI